MAKVVAAGTNVDLWPDITGSMPLHYAWNKGSTAIIAATNRVFQLLNVMPTNSGDYVVSVWNHIGGPINVTLPLRVVIPPRLQFGVRSGPGTVSFATIAGQRYVIEQTDALGGTWIPASDAFVADGSNVLLTNSPEVPARFYRVRVE